MHFALNIKDVTIADCVLTNNFAWVYGSALCVEENMRRLRVTNTTFSNNLAWGQGGGAYLGVWLAH